MIYMFYGSDKVPCVWKELTLRWEGLGDQRQWTTTENFKTLAEKLRTLVPHAFHDQRLLKNKRRADISVFAGGGKERRLRTSNAGENDLASFLLVRGHVEGQL